MKKCCENVDVIKSVLVYIYCLIKKRCTDNTLGNLIQ
jgi:hypothetical protein